MSSKKIMVSDTSRNIIAPAKVNLTLQVTGKREDGYHLLHSLTAFSQDFGDEITITASDNFKFTQSVNNLLPNSDDNLIVKTAKALAEKYDKDLLYHIHLNKKIPIGAGLGGGSSDAASVIKALLKLWDITPDETDLNKFMLSIGADVPICYHGKMCIMEGVGEKITPLESTHSLYALLVYPNQFNATENIFRNFNQDFSQEPLVTENIWQIIENGSNDLTQSAIQTTPIIKDVLKNLKNLKDYKIARMSGSGSSCFGLFDTAQAAQKATDSLQTSRPDWWVQPVALK